MLLFGQNTISSTTSTILSLAFLVSDVLVDPATARPTVQKRGLPGAVYICTEDNFRGECSWLQPNDRCHIPGTGDNSPRSIGPDPGGFCLLFKQTDCQGNQLVNIHFPGLETDAKIPEFGSLKCFKDDSARDATPPGVFPPQGANGTMTTGATAGLAIADPRLSGGVGSMERKKHEKALKQMEKDGFRQGMIGLKKGMYY